MKRSHKVRRASGAVIDTLENRRLLSTVSLVSNGDGTNTLNIVGTNSKDNVYVFDDPINNFVEVVDDKNGNKIAEPSEINLFDPADLSIISADMKKGNDKLEIHGITTYDGKDRSLEIEMGDGDDTFLFTTDPARDVPLGLDSDSLGGDIQDGSDFNFDIHGDSGKDNLTLDLGRTSIAASEVTAQIDAASGDDTVNVNLPDSNSEEFIGFAGMTRDIVDEGTESLASVLQIDIDLGSGNDTLNQVVNTDIFNDSSVTINVIGQSGKDTYNDSEDFGVRNGSSLTVNADLGSSDDRYHGIFDFTSRVVTAAAKPLGALALPGVGIFIDSSSSANFILHGSDGNDKLEVDHVNELPVLGPSVEPSEAIFGLMNIQLYGNDGNDLAEIDLDPGPSVNVASSGIFRGVVSGDRGNDHVRLDMVAGGTAGTYDLSILGGLNNDSLGAAFLDATSGGVSYGPRGGILVDGGSSTDKWDTEGNGTFKLRSVETLTESLENPFV